jgi:TBC1 domain family protein 5
MDTVTQDINEQFDLLFVHATGPTLLQKEALSGRLKHYKLRSMAWRLYLAPLRIDYTALESVTAVEARRTSVQEAMLQQVRASRAQYEQLRGTSYINPSRDRELDPRLNNPLAPGSDSPWSKFFQDTELEKDITQDLERLHPEHEFFAQKELRALMLRVLFVYAKEHAEIGYRQGMHELLANIVYLLEQEKRHESSDAALHELLPHTHLEHDAYTLFSGLMQRQRDYYAVNKGGANPILVKSAEVQNTLLAKHDAQLARHMTQLGIEPQLYMIKWVKLLFGREFHFEDVLTIWDAVFAYDAHNTLLDYIAVAMLIYIREQLLHMDYSACLKRLLKYPPVEDVVPFTENALALTRNQSIVQPTPEKRPAAPNSSPLADARPLSHPLAAPKKDRAAAPSSASVPPKRVKTAGELLQEEVTQLKGVQHNVAGRIDSIVTCLQTQLLTLPNLNDTTYLAVAELKRIKDILMGHLPVTTESALLNSNNNSNNNAAQSTDEHESSNHNDTSSTTAEEVVSGSEQVRVPEEPKRSVWDQ